MLRCHAEAHALIDTLAESAHDGALVIRGDVGSGKSTLLSALHGRYSDAALVRVNRGESGWPLSGISAIISAVGNARAADFTGRFALRSDDDTALAEAAAELLALLRGLDLPRTLLLVDDVDRMDAASRAIIGYMAGHLAGSGIRLVATAAQLHPDEPLAGVAAARLPPLEHADAEWLAPAGIDAGTLRILHTAAGGNLGAFMAMLESLSPEQRVGRDALRIPARPGAPAWAALERVTERLGLAHMALLDRLATAALHGRSSIPRWSAEAEDALQELLDLGVAREAGPYVHLADPLVRSALADALPSRARRELHLELSASCDPLLAAWHASWADPARELRAELLAAAVEAARDGHVGASVEFADRAVRGGHDGLAGSLAVLADELLTAGEPELADRYLRMATVDRDADPDARTRLELSQRRTDYLAGRLHSTATPRSDAGTDLELTLRAAATRAAIAAARGDVAEAHDALARVDGYAAEGLAATTGAFAAAARMLLGEIPADPPGAEEHDPLLLVLHARAATLAEDYPGARALIARLGRTLPRPSRMWAGWLTTLAIDCAVRAGRVGEALELARDWQVRHGGDPGPQATIPIGAWALIAEGDLDGADALLADWTDNAIPRIGSVPTARGLLLRAELARIRGAEAAACELLLLADALAAPIANPGIVRHLPELAETLAAVGRFGAAQRAATRLAEAARTRPTRWAVLAAARAELAIAPDAELHTRYAAARALHRPDDSGFELGKLLRTSARRFAAIGAAREAERAAVDARIAFTGAGARGWAAAVASPAAVTAGAAATPASPDSAAVLDALTADERAVVELVVRGLHNKEIAASLYLSVRTVELRLTRIYRKVGARSRAHLVSLVS